MTRKKRSERVLRAAALAAGIPGLRGAFCLAAHADGPVLQAFGAVWMPILLFLRLSVFSTSLVLRFRRG